MDYCIAVVVQVIGIVDAAKSVRLFVLFVLTSIGWDLYDILWMECNII